MDAMQSTLHFGQYWELCPGDQDGPAARRYFLTGSFAFLRGRLRNTTARKCIRHGFLLEDKLKGKYAAAASISSSVGFLFLRQNEANRDFA